MKDETFVSKLHNMLKVKITWLRRYGEGRANRSA